MVAYSDLLRGMFNHQKPEEGACFTATTYPAPTWSITTKERRQVHYHAARPAKRWKK